MLANTVKQTTWKLGGKRVHNNNNNSYSKNSSKTSSTSNNNNNSNNKNNSKGLGFEERKVMYWTRLRIAERHSVYDNCC